MPRGNQTGRQAQNQYLADLAKKRSAAAAAQSAAARRAAEQQRYYQQRAQQEASARQAQQQKAQEAMQRRATEQQAYYAEQQKRQAEARRLQGAQARSDAMRTARRTHTVKTGDTAESIAKTYGMEARAVAGQVPRLRPGQQLTFDVPQAIQREDRPMRGGPPEAGTEAGRYTGDVSQAWRGVMGGMEDFAQYGGVQGQLAKWGAQAMPTLMGALGRVGITLGEGGGEFFGADTQAMGEWGEQMAQYGEEMTQTPGYMGFVGAEMQRADLSQYNVARRVPGGIHDQMDAAIDAAQQQKSLFATSMRYTGQTLATAYEAMIGGDPDWDRFLKDSDGNIVMTISDNRWDQGPMMEQFTPDMIDKIKEMGFVEIEPGLMMVPTVEEFGYGMGDYTFPGYGGGFGGFGGGGGDYEYLSRGGTMRRKKGGGISTGERYRIFPEGVSPAHWRI